MPAARGAAALGLALAWFAWAGPALAVQVSPGSGYAYAGQTVDIAVQTTRLTGLGVLSYQFSLGYPAHLLTATEIVTDGTLTATAGWGAPVVGLQSGRIDVSAAGTRPLQGAGDLVMVRFVVNPAAVTGSSAQLQFSMFRFNEGTPRETLGTSYVQIPSPPRITLSPATGEIARGQTLQFGVSGSVVPPVVYSTRQPSVASISATGLLTGLATGSVDVIASDAAGHRDTTDSPIVVRAAQVSVGAVYVAPGAPVSIPVSVTELGGAGIRSGQVVFSYPTTLLTPTGASVAGGVMASRGSLVMGVGAGTVTISFADATEISGSGLLCTVTGTAGSTTGGSPLALQTAVFNENLPARRLDGYLGVSLPTFAVGPENVTLLAGQTTNFGVSGQYTAPITWTTLDPGVATINSSGILTGISGGTTRVRARDAVGATDENTAVTVFDVSIRLANLDVSSNSTVQVPVTCDRTLDGLGIRSVQFAVSYDTNLVKAVRVLPGLLASSWGSVSWAAREGSVSVAAAGATPLVGAQTTLCVLEMDIARFAQMNASSNLTFTACSMNEGRPLPVTTNGFLRVTTAVGVDPASPPTLSLAPPWPNPGGPPISTLFVLPGDGAGGATFELAIFALDGRRVRTLAAGPGIPGAYRVSWDGLDASGAPAAAGLYFMRMRAGVGSAERRIVLLH